MKNYKIVFADADGSNTSCDAHSSSIGDLQVPSQTIILYDKDKNPTAVFNNVLVCRVENN